MTRSDRNGQAGRPRIHLNVGVSHSLATSSCDTPTSVFGKPNNTDNSGQRARHSLVAAQRSGCRTPSSHNAIPSTEIVGSSVIQQISPGGATPQVWKCTKRGLVAQLVVNRTDGPDLSPAAPHPADRAKSGASHFLALIFLLVIPATDVEGHGPDPCANAEAAALALALRAVTRGDPESAEVLLERWESLSARCKSLTEPDYPDPVPDVEGHDPDPEYEASLLRGQRKACRQGKWEVREMVDKVWSVDSDPAVAVAVAMFHIFLEGRLGMK